MNKNCTVKYTKTNKIAYQQNIVIMDIRLQSSTDSSFPKTITDKIDYLIALISEFAEAHQLSTQVAYLYLNKFSGLNFADKSYDVNHTLSFDNVN